MGRKSIDWPKLCHIPCRSMPQTDSRCPSPDQPLLNPSARVPDSQRSARMSEIYCQLDNLSSTSDEFHGAFDKFSIDSLQKNDDDSNMTHMHGSSENETLENQSVETHSILDTLTMSSLATNFTLALSDDESSEMNNDDFILKILNRIIDIALSIVEKQENEGEIESVPSEDENEEMNEKKAEEGDHEVEFEQVDEEIQKIPKLNLNRLMSARSTCSVKSRISLKSIKSSIGSRSEGEHWNWRHLVPGMNWMSSNWRTTSKAPLLPSDEDKIFEADQLSIHSVYSTRL